MKRPYELCNKYAELFFRLLLKKAYKNADFKNLKIISNISDTGILNIIATDGRYNYDLYTQRLKYKGQEVCAFEISRYSETTTYSDTRIFLPDTFERIE